MNLLKRINNIVLLARCVARVLFHGKADKVPGKLSRVVVMPDGKLGDVVCGTPVLVAIRDHFPEAHIIVGGNASLHRALLSDSGLVDEYLELGTGGDMIARIKECNADAVLITGPSFGTAASSYLAGVPLVAVPVVQGGLSPYETRPYKIICQFVATFPYRMCHYAPRERLRVLEPLGIFTDNTTKHLGFSKEAEEKVKRFFKKHDVIVDKDVVVGISPSAGHKIKEWPEDRFAKVADYLVEQYHARVVLIGGPNDGHKIAKVLSQSAHAGQVINAQGVFDLDELKALISRLALFISVDTGPIYIAEAFGIPTVDIIGPIDENEQPPRGPLHRNVVPPKRVRPELFVLDARSYDCAEAQRQVASITVPLVLQEIDHIMMAIQRHGSST